MVLLIDEEFLKRDFTKQRPVKALNFYVLSETEKNVLTENKVFQSAKGLGHDLNSRFYYSVLKRL